jgi:hypothetical protein
MGTAKGETVWLMVGAGSSRRARLVPGWKRSACLCGGEVYIPAAVLGDERRVLLHLIADGVGFVRDSGHTYVPASWAKRGYPAEVELVDGIERLVREQIGRVF